MPRSKIPLPHRMPGMPDDRTTPVVPPASIPRQCPECSGEGLCRECGGTKLLHFADVDSVTEQPCDSCLDDCDSPTGLCGCCRGAGTVTSASYYLWMHDLR